VSNPLPPGPFATFLVDPPWKFVTYDGKRSIPQRAATQSYQSMTIDDLKALPVAASAAKDATMLMWVVDAHLLDALAVADAWGFTFKTFGLIWLKTPAGRQQFGFFPPDPVRQMSLGYWTRKQAEVCLLFTRGKPKRIGKGVRQIIEAPRRQHSRKPDEQYERIEALVGGPYLEMFARQQRPGWTSWGNEPDKFTSPRIPAIVTAEEATTP
jgi:N6-adenosine-specific RNA methylase IME4